MIAKGRPSLGIRVRASLRSGESGVGEPNVLKALLP